MSAETIEKRPCEICGSPSAEYNTSDKTHKCIRCGHYKISSEINVQDYIAKSGKFGTNYADCNFMVSSRYEHFLTYFLQSLWENCVKNFQLETDRDTLVGYPAVITESLLDDSLKTFRYLNISDQIDKAIIALAWNEQGLFTGYNKLFSSSSNINIYVMNRTNLFYRLMGIYLPFKFDDQKSINVCENVLNNKSGPLVVLLKGAKRQELITFGDGTAQLTYKGWTRYNELISENRQTTTAFMAMGFTPSNQKAYKCIFQPAVEACGFTLQTADADPNHGSIIDDIELKIKRAPFVIVDISHGNSGAYWEAGYAKALGKPVIYTCDKPTWESRDKTDEISRLIRPHFDIIHCNTVQWCDISDETEMREQNIAAFKTIKDMIRNNIPGARLDDKSEPAAIK